MRKNVKGVALTQLWDGLDSIIYPHVYSKEIMLSPLNYLEESWHDVE